MKKKILKFCQNIIIKNNPKITETELEVINYGLEGMYLTITKTIIIFLVAILLNIFKEMLLTLLFYNVIRFSAFGLHAKSSIQCLINSLIFFIGGAYLGIILKIPIIIKIILSVICIILIAIYAPADTQKRPLINKKKRIKFKILSIISSIILTILIFLPKLSHLSNFILIGLIEEAIMILPITYKIYKLPYNNYKTYKEV